MSTPVFFNVCKWLMEKRQELDIKGIINSSRLKFKQGEVKWGPLEYEDFPYRFEQLENPANVHIGTIVKIYSGMIFGIHGLLPLRLDDLPTFVKNLIDSPILIDVASPERRKFRTYVIDDNTTLMSKNCKSNFEFQLEITGDVLLENAREFTTLLDLHQVEIGELAREHFCSLPWTIKGECFFTLV